MPFGEYPRSDEMGRFAESMKRMTPKKRNIQQEAEETTNFIFKLIFKSFLAVLNVLMTIVLIGLVAGCVVGCAFLIYVSNHIDSDVDDIIVTSGKQDSTTRMFYYDADGNLVEAESERLVGGTNRLWISYDEIPDDLINAFVAIEDKRFWEHSGVDWITTIQATLKYFLPMGGKPGGSTITQQLVKNVTGDDDYTIQRKVQEIFKSLNLEKEKEKTEIIEMYLNTIYLSQNCNGVQAAANAYFGKDASELTLVECAAIAGITQFPTKWDPYVNPENNKYRRNIILKEMYKQGFITYAEYEEAYNQDIVLASDKGEEDSDLPSSSSGTTSWYTDVVIEDAAALLMEKYNVSYQIAVQMVYTGGYTIVTAMDQEMQDTLEKYYADPNLIEDKNKVVIKQSSMLIMDQDTGNVLALVGGRGEKTSTRVLNRATQTKRQPGSSIKPIASYAQAMEMGFIHYASIVDDTPYNFGDKIVSSNGKVKYSKTSGWPQNANRKYAGLTTIDYALQTSKNTVAIKLLAQVGLDTSYDFLTEKLGFTSLIDNVATANGVKTDKTLAGLGLGGLTYGVTVREMVAAYGIFPTGGIYREPRTILEIRDGTGHVIVDNQNDAEVVLQEGTAQMMVRLMEHVITGSGGTATSMKPLHKLVGAAGKTGTTDDNNDKWFVGFTPYVTAGVWVGYDEPQDLGSVSENTAIWREIMMDIHQNIILPRVEAGQMEKKTFDDNLLIEAQYCSDSGKLITAACEADPRGSRVATGYFTRATLPTEGCDKHVFVAYCTEGNGIAGPGCPELTIVQYGLLNHIRNFACSIYVTDGQYTWTDLGAIAPDLRPGYPFYQKIYENGYPGKTNTSRQFNCYCTTHNQ